MRKLGISMIFLSLWSLSYIFICKSFAQDPPPWPTRPIITSPSILPEQNRKNLESYREELELKRKSIERKRQEEEIDKGEYLRELQKYNKGIEFYRDGIRNYRDAKIFNNEE